MVVFTWNWFRWCQTCHVRLRQCRFLCQVEERRRPKVQAQKGDTQICESRSVFRWKPRNEAKPNVGMSATGIGCWTDVLKRELEAVSCGVTVRLRFRLTAVSSQQGHCHRRHHLSIFSSFLTVLSHLFSPVSTLVCGGFNIESQSSLESFAVEMNVLFFSRFALLRSTSCPSLVSRCVSASLHSLRASPGLLRDFV